MSSDMASKTFFQVFGVIYAVVAVLGFLMGNAPLLGIVSNNSADSVLHVVIAVVALYLGFGMSLALRHPPPDSNLRAAPGRDRARSARCRAAACLHGTRDAAFLARRQIRCQRGAIESVVAQLALACEQDGDVLAPARLQNRVAVDVDLLDGNAGGHGERHQCRAHVVAEVAIGANEQSEARQSMPAT